MEDKSQIPDDIICTPVMLKTRNALTFPLQKFFLMFILFLRERERQTEHEQGRGRERGRHRI